MIPWLGGFHYAPPFQSNSSYNTSFQASLTALCSKHSSLNYKAIIHQFRRKILPVLERLTQHRQNSHNSWMISFCFSVTINQFVVVENNELLNSWERPITTSYLATKQCHDWGLEFANSTGLLQSEAQDWNLCYKYFEHEQEINKVLSGKCLLVYAYFFFFFFFLKGFASALFCSMLKFGL